MAFQQGVVYGKSWTTDGTYNIAVDWNITNPGYGPIHCMDLSPYPQAASTMTLAYVNTGSVFITGYVLKVNINGNTIPLSASGDHGVFKWDSTGGAWATLSGIVANDWVLTDTYNGSYGDNFWQVSSNTAMTETSYQYAQLHHSASVAADHQNIGVSALSTGARIIVRTY